MTLQTSSKVYFQQLLFKITFGGNVQGMQGDELFAVTPVVAAHKVEGMILAQQHCYWSQS